MFDVQEIAALGIAAASGAWVLWSTLKPFVRRVASACGMCSGCASDAPVPQDDLLQIDPPGPA